MKYHLLAKFDLRDGIAAYLLNIFLIYFTSKKKRQAPFYHF